MKIKITYLNDFTPELKDKIKKSFDWLHDTANSDEFKWKTRKFPERDEFIKLINNLHEINISKISDKWIKENRPAMYNQDKDLIRLNPVFAEDTNIESLGGMLGHEAAHESDTFDHGPFDIDGFPGYVQNKMEYLEGKSNLYYKALLWLYDHKTIKWILIGALIITIILMTFLW